LDRRGSVIETKPGEIRDLGLRGEGPPTVIVIFKKCDLCHGLGRQGDGTDRKYRFQSFVHC
jgi:hypothetical protein